MDRNETKRRAEEVKRAEEANRAAQRAHGAFLARTGGVERARALTNAESKEQEALLGRICDTLVARNKLEATKP